MLAQQDVKQAYRRSSIGPFWLTIGIAVQILTIGLVFGLIFKSDLKTYVPFLSVSLVIWNLFANSLSDGASAFISSEAIIKQLHLPHVTFVVRGVIRNLLIASHNAIILPLVALVFGIWPNFSLLSLVPGLVLSTLNLVWVSWLLAIISARYRDMQQILNSLILIAFYTTPVMWFPSLLDDSGLAHLVLGLNPLYHWLQIVRLPIMGQWPTWENWGLAMISAGFGWLATLVVYTKSKNKIAYWV